ncbi:hypothetical protein L596_022917 [Steinernema carpocapsae]|uniref:Uncharacterized protein n=1 Tax=Steinernema carpocapsae TaxID=34508 RepID=A0A4U5MC87_STECR|nr:hypothetical protein L596_022917 [Steinernema carpocapsae]
MVFQEDRSAITAHHKRGMPIAEIAKLLKIQACSSPLHLQTFPGDRQDQGPSEKRKTTKRKDLRAEKGGQTKDRAEFREKHHKTRQGTQSRLRDDVQANQGESGTQTIRS